MSTEYIFNQLKTIDQANGYLMNVTDVVEGEGIEGLRPRGVAVNQCNGSVTIRINAETKTLELLKQYIGSVLDADFVIDQADDDDTLTATPKQAAPPAAKEDGDATA